MRFGSVCSGIEAATVASRSFGWEATWFSEIEPFPSAVLKHHYPEVPNYGDMNVLPERIASGEIEAPDMVVAGTPCQAFSTAGKRLGLDDDRGNLTLKFVEIIDEVDNARRRIGKEPCIMFWENVPGVLTSKDNAFGCFLAGIAGEDEPLVPPRGKWSNAGVVVGPKRTIAWRVLDAQYFGLAQRRRRVFVIASAGDVCPAEILFECDSVRRDSPPSREARKEVAENIGRLLTGTDCYNGAVTGEVAATMGTPGSSVNASGPTVMVDKEELVSGTDMFNCALTGEISTTVKAGRGPNSMTAMVKSTIPIDMRNACRDPEKHDAMNRQGVGFGKESDPSHTVTSTFVPGVSAVIGFKPGSSSKARSIGDQSEMSPTLEAGGGGNNKPAIAFQRRMVRTTGGQPEKEINPCLTSNSSGDAMPCIAKGVVRRLTPVECERLQGFPDNYTQISWKGKPKEECPTGHRYKAIGNSWAVKCVRWIFERIESQTL